MKVIIREERSGVAEVVGTILILAMTVVLFSVIIIWVTNIPTPAAQTRVDISGVMSSIYSPITRLEIGVNITLTHGGGEALTPVPTIIYIVDQRGGAVQTDAQTLHLFNPKLANPSGLMDGADSVWDIGERWGYQNFQFRTADNITVTIVDTTRGTVVWSGQMNALAGQRPPIISNVWTDGDPTTPTLDPVQQGKGFALYATVSDPDGDLNPNSVYALLTPWLGLGGVCSVPLQMNDKGVAPDSVAGDGVFSLGFNFCMNPPYPALSWDGMPIILNATDFKGHQTTTRFTLHVFPPSGGGGAFNNQTIPSALWQYIGFIQIRTGQTWVTNLDLPYSSNVTFNMYRTTTTLLNGNGGPLFHLKMSNHGNTTIFIDGWTLMSFSKETSASVFPVNIVRPVNPNIPANAGGLAAYPGTPTNPNDFQWAQVFDVNLTNQEAGGPPVVMLFAAKTNFKADWPQNFVSNSYFINILISGMAGPAGYTLAMLMGNGGNPALCTGLGPTYNPILHLNDVNPLCRSTFYAQVIPFIGMVVY